MVLGGGDGSKPSVSFLNFEPKSQSFPGFGDSVAFEILFVRLATDIRTIEKAFCVLVVELLVDNVLAVFDGVCCGNQHVDTSAV